MICSLTQYYRLKRYITIHHWSICMFKRPTHTSKWQWGAIFSYRILPPRRYCSGTHPGALPHCRAVRISAFISRFSEPFVSLAIRCVAINVKNVLIIRQRWRNVRTIILSHRQRFQNSVDNINKRWLKYGKYHTFMPEHNYKYILS